MLKIKGDRKKILNIILKIIIVVAVLILIYSVYKVYKAYKEYSEIDDANNKLIETAVKQEDNKDINKNKTADENTTAGSSENGTVHTYDLNIDWQKLKNINKDIVAWINIPNTNISYPIVKVSNNQEYLKKDFYGNYSKGGCPFVDYRIEKPFKCYNTIIYGHNLNNGSMFSSLKKYSNREYLNNNRDINIYTEDGLKRVYKIFSSSTVSAVNEDIYDTSVDTAKQYFEIIKKYSSNFIDENIAMKRPMITLSTCTNQNKQQRYVVHAYLQTIE